MKHKQNRTKHSDDVADKTNDSAYRVRLPGFIRNEEIGLGDLIKRATSAFGVKPCGGCTRRAAVLDRWIVFSGKR